MTAVRPGRLRVASLWFAVAAATSLLSACSTNTNFHPGTPVMTLSSTNTTFASYIVDIDAITFTGPNGVYATPVITPVTVDLTKQTDLTAVLAAAPAPQATYTSATITIDYTYADIWVNDNGVSRKVAPIVVVAGNSVLTAAIVVTFDPKHPLVVTNQESTLEHINFDLDAFNSIDLPDETVTVLPYATMNPPTPLLDKSSMRMRGEFVYTQANAFVMNILSFDGYGRPLGGVTVDVTPETYYNIDGVIYVGAAGLAALNSEPLNIVIAAYGTFTSLSGITPTYVANTVIAGTSQESPLQDRITGVVGRRDGDLITVIGGQYVESSSGDPYYPYGVGVAYIPSTVVKLADTSIVSEDGVVGTFNINDISVGQVITALGTGTFDSSGDFIGLDATASAVRLQSTRVWGVLNPAPGPNGFSLDVDTLGGWAAYTFDFAGAASAGNVVTAADYKVNSGTMDQSATAPGTLLAVDGIVTPFGTAPPDFTATAVTPGTATQQELLIEWVAPGTTKPFSVISPTELVVDYTNLAVFKSHDVYTGPVPLDLTSGVTITTVGADQSQLVLSLGGSVFTTGISIFTDPATAAADFSAALTTAFAGVHTAVHLVAFGTYNSASNTFVATRIDVGVQN